jgi:hypothetical protein
MRSEFNVSFQNARAGAFVGQIMKTFRLSQTQATDLAVKLFLKELMIMSSMA